MTPTDTAGAIMQRVLIARQAGVRHPDVLAQLAELPRALFVDPVFQDQSEQDLALPISCGQTISQPSVVARMTEALELQPRSRLLEIGTGSGYQTAFAAPLCRQIYSIERHAALSGQAEARLRQLGIRNAILRVGDGTRGWPEAAPFDRILLTAAAEDPPKPLLDQLQDGGIMVLPVGQSDSAQLLLKVKRAGSTLEYHELGTVRFVSLVEGTATASTV